MEKVNHKPRAKQIIRAVSDVFGIGLDDLIHAGRGSRAAAIARHAAMLLIKDEHALSRAHIDAVVSAGKSRNVYPDAFEQFWRQYPDTRNNSKGRAFAEWRKLSAADRAAATSALRGYARYCLENKDYRCIHAERFISHRRFDAYASQAQSPDGSAASATVWWQDPEKVSKITDAQWRGSIAKHANGVWPPDKLGPAPGSKRCVVPSHIIDELKLTERYDANGISKEPH